MNGLPPPPREATLLAMRVAPNAWLSMLLPVLAAGCEHLPPPRALPDTIYLLGSFEAPGGRAEFAADLRRKGYRVAADLDDSVDTVVVGRPPQQADGASFVPLDELPEYQRALRRGLRLLAPQEAIALPRR